MEHTWDLPLDVISQARQDTDSEARFDIRKASLRAGFNAFRLSIAGAWTEEAHSMDVASIELE